MLYLDMTTKNPERITVNLSPQELKNLIKQETGRTLVFENQQLASTYDRWFKLVRLPSPIGFTLVANERIPKNTLLCPYGGISIPLENNLDDDIEYILSAERDGVCIREQCQSSGDLGAFFSHLPDQYFLEELQMEPQHWPLVQMKNVHNVPLLVDGVHRIYAIASCDIEPGTVLGFSYGVMYWADRATSPLLFKKNHIELLDMNQVSYDSFVVFCNREGSTRVMSKLGRLELSLTSLSHILSQVTTQDLADTAVLETFLPPNTPGARFFQQFVLTTDEALAALQAQSDTSRETFRPPLYCFFKSYQLVSSCAPPPGSVIRQGRTIVPQTGN